MENERIESNDEPLVLASHLIYFFIPLPDCLELPDMYELKMVEQTPAEKIINERIPPVNLGASLRFHRVEYPLTYVEDITTLFAVAEKSLPEPNDGEHGSVNPDETSPSNPEAQMKTVVELAIAADGLNVEPATADSPANESFEDRLSEEFDRGIDYIRQFQRAYYLAQRQPIRLVTRESLPPLIPFGIREVYSEDGEPLPFTVPLSMYITNSNIPISEEPYWNDEKHNRLSIAIEQHSNEGPLLAYMDLAREAEVAFQQDGNYRSVALFAASACEVLLDELLAHLMWEEGNRPEDVSEIFDLTIAKRVKKHFHSRIGGSWKLDTEGPIRDWFANVAGLRNRVSHGGYEPSPEEARRSINTMSTLAIHLGDRVANHTRKYPRTALILPGEEGLVRRRKWAQKLDALRNDSAEVQWHQTFGRWRLAMNRSRPDSPLARTPSTTMAKVYVVVRADDSEQWIVHDPAAGMAANVSCSDANISLTSEARASIKQLVDSISEQTGHSDTSIYIAGAHIANVPAERWIPEYRLLPQTGVMVTGDDLDPA